MLVVDGEVRLRSGAVETLARAGDVAVLPAGIPDFSFDNLPESVPALVTLAGPDEQIVAVGDGTHAEPGRYLIACFIPTGADPDEYTAAAATSDGPPGRSHSRQTGSGRFVGQVPPTRRS